MPEVPLQIGYEWPPCVEHTVEQAPKGWLSLPAGIGLIMANMIGAGVFLSTGFMAQDMGPGAIMLAWVVHCALRVQARAHTRTARSSISKAALAIK